MKAVGVNLRGLIFAMLFAATGCSPTIPVIRADLAPSAGESAVLRLNQGVTFTLPTGYARALRQGTRWIRIGRIQQGTVFKPVDSVFTVEGAHVREAYLVIRDTKLVGFYLPVERAFSHLDEPLILDFSTGGN